ncbi:hypothetical protein BDD12DRAFT_876284 [Trichophaea hybrida]|nr:hypothetical protein BDD12DRAFT_879563 [Trichophaea hybrida]KAF8542495.1 hypothetical protein BDD12DRAFT_876284 [Trichophaea hybrida]
MSTTINKNPFATNSRWNNSAASSAIWPEKPDYSFCRLDWARSALVGTRLYIDGGVGIPYPYGTTKPTLDPNNRLIWVDLDKDFVWQDPPIQSAAKPDNVPSLSWGSTFVPDLSIPKFYIFGGVYNAQNNLSSRYKPPPQDPAGKLFSFDRRTRNGKRSIRGVSASANRGGMTTVDTNRGVGYYLGGYYDPATTASYIGPTWRWLVVNGLLVFNTSNMSWRNETVPGEPTVRGFLNYIPLGLKGVLVWFGGEKYAGGRYNSIGVLNSMSEINIYDIDSGTWHTQTANGNPFLENGDSGDQTPEPRQEGCSVVMTAPDKSSYNIYVYSGMTDHSGIPGHRLNDLWVLSLPSFNWIKLWAGNFAF